MSAGEKDRIDLWLKLCCVFKHRSDATEACKGGLVKINGTRCKPSASVRIGDRIEISGDHPRNLVVQGIPAGSVAKEVARTMYIDETPPPVPKDRFDPRTTPIVTRERGSGRPTKRERREIEKFRR